MSSLASRFHRRYGASPLHLLAFIFSIAVTGAAVIAVFGESTTRIVYISAWFLGAIVAHDMIILPLYSALDRLALRLSRRARGSAADGGPVRSPGWVYVRVPLALSLLLLLVFGPEILRAGNATFRAASGQTQDVYLTRYLTVVAILFGVSALVYLGSVARASSRIP